MISNSQKKRYWIKRGIIFFMLGASAFVGFRYRTRINWNPSRTIGQSMDSLDGVPVYYNGGVNQTHGRNTAPDGYNVGLRYQCVEFVKRYYLEHFRHKMHDAYGHAKDFYDPAVADGGMNKARGLLQYKNGGGSLPRKGDLLIWGPSFWNKYGHVAIVADLEADEEGEMRSVTIIQQNPGPYGNARELISVTAENRLDNVRILGWLRMP